ncbi:MAG TPA: alpha/beta hydrolase [Bryobacteraceae bacterium]|nr:alpha/beta hydrolase [Bryobacteraceae bacterium]
MPLDPSIRSRLDSVAALGLPPAESLTPVEARQRLAILVSQQPPLAIPGVTVANILVPADNHSIPARLYAPGSKDKDKVPLVIWFHGGGWVTGTLDSHDRFCRQLAHESQAAVLSVDYRLAPEYPFPAAPEDCLAATDWAFAQTASPTAEVSIDPARIFVAGDSAGGNLAAVVSLMRRDRAPTPALAGQILLWPVVGYYDPPTPSYLANAEGFGLTRNGMIHFWDLYLPDRSASDFAYAVPLRSHDLSGLPPALVITAEYDILRDEGDEYAARLRSAGVAVEHRCFSGVNHGFAVWPDHDPALPQARAVREILARWLRA